MYVLELVRLRSDRGWSLLLLSERGCAASEPDASSSDLAPIQSCSIGMNHGQVNVVLGMRKASLVQIVTTRTPFSSKKLRNSRRVASVQPRLVVVPSAVQPSGEMPGWSWKEGSTPEAIMFSTWPCDQQTLLVSEQSAPSSEGEG